VSNKNPIKLKCQRCDWNWNYSGTNEWMATCPHCGTKVHFGGGKNIVGAKG